MALYLQNCCSSVWSGRSLGSHYRLPCSNPNVYGHRWKPRTNFAKKRVRNRLELSFRKITRKQKWLSDQAKWAKLLPKLSIWIFCLRIVSRSHEWTRSSEPLPSAPPPLDSTFRLPFVTIDPYWLVLQCIFHSKLVQLIRHPYKKEILRLELIIAVILEQRQKVTRLLPKTMILTILLVRSGPLLRCRSELSLDDRKTEVRRTELAGKVWIALGSADCLWNCCRDSTSVWAVSASWCRCTAGRAWPERSSDYRSAMSSGEAAWRKSLWN